MLKPATPLFFQLSGLFAALAVLMMLLGARKHKVSVGSAGLFAALSIALGLLAARLIFCTNPEKASLIFYDALGRYTGVSAFWQPAGSGFHISGFILGIFLAAVITSRITRSSFFSLLDSICLPALFLFAAIRCIEPLSDAHTLKGFSGVVENTGICFSPLFRQFASVDPFTGETIVYWKLAVHLLEALLAAIILLALCRKKLAPGFLSLYTAILFSASQLLPESLRQDGPLCISIFLRVTYIAYGVLYVLAVMYILLRAWRHGTSIKRLAADALIAVICMGLFVVLEFALDGKVILFPPDVDHNLKITLLYAFMALVLIIMAYVPCRRLHKENKIALAQK